MPHKGNSSSVQLFNFQDQPVQVVMINGEPWWVAADVCKIFEIANVSQAVESLDEDEKLIYTLYISGQNRKVLLINEPGLYGLVLVSRKPQAKDFKRWLKHEVLPSIRKTGSYSVSQVEPLYFNKAFHKNVLENESRVLLGYWMVSIEMGREAWSLRAYAAELQHNRLPEGSAGRKWRQYLEVIGWDLSKSRQIWAAVRQGPDRLVYVYPDELLFQFRQWLRVEYAEYYVRHYLPQRELKKQLA